MYIKADENGVLQEFLGVVFEIIRVVKDDPVITDEGDEIDFILKNGDYFKMIRSPGCCESVYIEDICGELEWLIESPILTAKQTTNFIKKHKDDESETYTFYEFSTLKGSVTIRWYGCPNSHYSE